MAMTGGTGVLVKETTVTSNGYTAKFRLYVYHKLVSQDIIANTSTLSLGMYFTIPSGWTAGAWSKSSNSYLGTTANIFDGSIPKMSGTRWLRENQTLVVNHNPDGTGTATIYWKWGVNSSWGGFVNPSGSFTVDLPRIPRGATLTAAPNFNDEENPTITYSNPAGDVVDTLQACISLDGSKDDIAYRDIDKLGSSYTFNLTDDERNVLINACKTSKNITVNFIIKTVIDEKTYSSSLNKTLTIVNANPILQPSVVDVNDVTKSLTGDENKLIKYYSNAKYIINATALKNSSISNYSVVCGGKSGTDSSGILYNIESGNFVFSVIDSRGNNTSTNVNKKLINYVKLTCNLDFNSPSAEGSVNLKIYGNCFNGNFGIKNNNLKLEYRYKISSGAYSNWIEIVEYSREGNEYLTEILLDGLDYRETYHVQARAIDELSTITSTEKIVNFKPVFDWSSSDFNFSVDVNIGGDLSIKGKSLVDIIYPVGSIYMSLNNTDPTYLFGGEWERLQGRVLVGAGTDTDINGLQRTFVANETGGEYNHTLTIDEMPSHTHIQEQHRHAQNKNTFMNDTQNYDTRSSGSSGYYMGANLATYYTDYETAINQNTGGSLSHNNVQPYLSVYMWKRIS